jgi:hypothetical protein
MGGQYTYQTGPLIMEYHGEKRYPNDAVIICAKNDFKQYLM